MFNLKPNVMEELNPKKVLKRKHAVLLLLLFWFPLVQAQISIWETDFYNSEDIGLYESSFIGSESKLVNNGKLVFSNNTNAQIEMYEMKNTHLGPGVFTLKGNDDVNWILDEAVKLGSIEFLSGSHYFEKSGIAIDSTLSLFSDQVYILDKEQSISLLNDNADALLFDGDINSQSYIIGKLERAMKKGEAYDFPVGDINQAYPFQIELGTEEKAVLGVEFMSDMVFDWLQANYDNPDATPLIEDGGWNVYSKQALGASLDLTTHKEAFSGIEPEDEIRFVRFEGEDFPYEDYEAIPDALSENAGGQVKAFSQKANAYYALTEKVMLDGESLSNFIVAKDGYEYHFIIPNVEQMPGNKLEVYDRWGQSVYERSPYRNDLNTKNLGVGTYYYVFTYNTGNGQETYQSFFEVYK